MSGMENNVPLNDLVTLHIIDEWCEVCDINPEDIYKYMFKVKRSTDSGDEKGE